MASKMEVLRDINENFLECPICMEQFRKPKMLPCLHRFCRACIVPTEDGGIQCYICREFHELPQDGVDGLKADFNTVKMIEYVRKGEMDGRRERRPSLPMCHTHKEKQLELICTTCGNLPVCTSCIAGGHGSHVQQGISQLAQIQKEKLAGRLACLEGYRGRISGRNAAIRDARSGLNHAVNEKRTALQNELVREEAKLKVEKRDLKNDLEKGKKEVTEIKQRERLPTREQLKQEMEEAKAKYDEFCREEEEQIEDEIQQLEAGHERDKAELDHRMKAMQEGNHELMSVLECREREKGQRIKGFSDEFDEDDMEYENITKKATGILVDEHNLIADVESSYVLCRRIDSLVDRVSKMRLDDTELRGLSAIEVGSLASFMARGTQVNITEEVESMAKIGKEGERWRILGIAGCGDGRIFITGEVAPQKSHITEIDLNGKKIKRKILETSSQSALRHCGALTDSQIATVCRPTEVGIYNVDQGSYRKTDITDVHRNAPLKREVTCVAVNRINGHIFAGRQQLRNVYEYSRDLEFVRALELPEVIQWPHDMTVHGGNLLICDPASKKAYAVSMGGRCEVRYQFSPPWSEDGGELKPYSVCTDKRSYVYMIWKETVTVQKLPVKKVQERMIIVQYSQDGQRLLQKRKVDCKGFAKCITVAETRNGEKLLIATEKTSQLIAYGLVTSRI